MKNKENKFYKFLRLAFFYIILMLPIFVFVDIVLAEPVASDLARQSQAFAGPEGANLGSGSDPRFFIATVIQYFLGMLGVLFLFYAIYAGYLIMFSRGEQEKVNKGKSTMRTAIIGVLVILTCYSLLIFVMRSIWQATLDPGGAYFEAGYGAEPYDFCRDGRGDPISCGRR
jgi:hypothetical protein